MAISRLPADLMTTTIDLPAQCNSDADALESNLISAIYCIGKLLVNLISLTLNPKFRDRLQTHPIAFGTIAA